MFETYFKSVIERLFGRKISVILDEAGVVSERTFRNWMDGTSKPDQHRLDAFSERTSTWLQRHISGKTDWPEEQRASYLDEIAANVGGASGVVHVVHWQTGRGCPATLELARRIDTLSFALAKQRDDQDIAGYTALFGADWLLDEHFHHPEQELAPAAYRASSARASAWTDLAVPTAVLLVNLQLQLLATLDHEFSMRYLPAFAPVPVFHGLFPDRAARKGGRARSRGAVRLPARRLLHMLACMRYYRKQRRWPVKAPSVDDTAKWMDVLPRDLAKWRMGRRFTLDDFDRVWDRMFKDFPSDTRPGAPTPLMFASVVLTRMFVIGTREQNNLSVAQGGAALYLDWWERQRGAAEAHFGKPHNGTEAWMPGLL
jgi:hypothetical protein